MIDASKSSRLSLGFDHNAAMNEQLPFIDSADCATLCAAPSLFDQLNRDCICIGVDPTALHRELEAVLGSFGLPQAWAESHPHLFAALPVFVSRGHIETMASVVKAIEHVIALAAYRTAVLAWAPQIASFDPGSPGGLLGLDFHLGPDGPRLIEINTNPGGALLNALLGRAQRACIPGLTTAPTDAGLMDQAVLASLLMEWQLQRGSLLPHLVAIVDEAPTRQYLYPEFVMYRELLRRHGFRAEICAPEELNLQAGRLSLNGEAVDLVYNRLTDFALQQPSQAALRESYLGGGVALSPHPRAHAIYADKRNLSLLGNREFLTTAGAGRVALEVLPAVVPTTQLLTPENRPALWENRRKLFFKPAGGFGSRASYRGDKLTRRVWDEIGEGVYVAQNIVPPSERQVASGGDRLKVDIRCYAYRGQALLYAARMYQGQTTNFRTPGGGFAPVLTSNAMAVVTAGHPGAAVP